VLQESENQSVDMSNKQDVLPFAIKRGARYWYAYQHQNRLLGVKSSEKGKKVEPANSFLGRAVAYARPKPKTKSRGARGRGRMEKWVALQTAATHTSPSGLAALRRMGATLTRPLVLKRAPVKQVRAKDEITQALIALSKKARAKKAQDLGRYARTFAQEKYDEATLYRLAKDPASMERKYGKEWTSGAYVAPPEVLNQDMPKAGPSEEKEPRVVLVQRRDLNDWSG